MVTKTSRKTKRPASGISLISKKIPTSRVFLILDASGSMQAVRKEVVDSINAQIAQIGGASASEKVETFVSLIPFASDVNAPLFDQVAPRSIARIERESYIPSGGTALFDVIGTTIQDAEDYEDEKGRETSILVMIFTDGEESGASSRFKAQDIANIIRAKIATDRWSFVFSAPPGKGDAIQNLFKLGSGNIQEWEASRAGVEKITRSINSGIDTYMRNVKIGNYSTRSYGSFFSPKLAGLSAAEVKRNLDDRTNEFFQWLVPIDQRIDELVHRRGIVYRPGSGYYQLVKKVTVQSFKDILIRDKVSGKVFGGDGIRDVLGIPEGGSIELYPSYSGKYDVFIMSTSWNRKLFGGTTLLYRK
jgi:hypothetical protein